MPTDRSILDASDPRPLHTRLRDWLVANIDSYPEGTRLPTEFELADRFGISRLTVHKVMGELQRDGYVVRMRSKGTFVARKDQRVRGNAAGNRGTVIVAYPDWFSFDIWQKVDLAEVQAVKHGFSLVNLKLTRLGGYESLRALVEEFEETRGVMVVPPGGNVSPDDRVLLDSLGVPVVVLCEVDDLNATRHLSSVCQDMDDIARRDVDAAVAAGARRLAHVGAEPWNPLLERFARSLREHAQGRIDLILPSPSTHAWQDSPAKAYHLARELLAGRPAPDALVLDSFPTALAASRAVHDLGRADALSLIVNAPYFGLERFLHPRAVRVASPLRGIVARAFELLAAETYPPAQRRWLIDAETFTPQPTGPAEPAL